MGEIGISRREFLYEIEFWEARRIVRGYRRRDRMKMELIRLCAYNAFYAMRENKTGEQPRDWVTLPWEKEDDEAAPISEEEVDDLQDMMRQLNEQTSQ